MDKDYRSILVASLLVLRQKIHSFHWEIVGISFHEIHTLLGKQYDEILLFADRVAEYMRTLDLHPPNTLKRMIELSKIKESDGSQLSPSDMILILHDDFKILGDYVNQLPDESRAWSNIMDDLHEFLMKQHWFMRSYLQ